MTAGNFNVYGGIYRDVRLVIKNRLHFPYQGSADYEGGAFITTPRVSPESAQICIKTWVRNDEQTAQECTIVTTVQDRDGRAVQRLQARASIPAGKVHIDRPIFSHFPASAMLSN
jgi:hypothetical protein